MQQYNPDTSFNHKKSFINNEAFFMVNFLGFGHIKEAQLFKRQYLRSTIPGFY